MSSTSIILGLIGTLRRAISDIQPAPEPNHIELIMNVIRCLEYQVLVPDLQKEAKQQYKDLRDRLREFLLSMNEAPTLLPVQATLPITPEERRITTPDVLLQEQYAVTDSKVEGQKPKRKRASMEKKRNDGEEVKRERKKKNQGENEERVPVTMEVPVVVSPTTLHPSPKDEQDIQEILLALNTPVC